MAILKVARLGHPVLRRVAEPFTPEEIRSPAVEGLVRDMLETMLEYDGAGLAAPQVHISRRLMIYGVDSNPRYPDAEDVPFTVLFNPKWEPLADETSADWEGCLSLPDLRGLVERTERIRVRALDSRSEPVEFEADGFHARVFQHEYDHLDGILFVDRMRDLRELYFLKEWARYSGDEEGGEDAEFEDEPEENLAAEEE